MAPDNPMTIVEKSAPPSLASAQNGQEHHLRSNEETIVQAAQVEALTRELAAVSAELAATRRSLERRELLADIVVSAINSVRTESVAQSGSGEAKQTDDEPFYVCNAHDDVKYAHQDQRFADVLHVFHLRWAGIRAAAGSLPGSKLGIASDRLLPGEIYKELISRLQSDRFQRIVFHGFSDTMATLVEAMAGLGYRDKLFIVYHGSPTQWLFLPERRYAFKALELAKKDRVRKFHLIKAGFDFPLQSLYRPMLFNLSPRVPRQTITSALEEPSRSVAFVPGWHGFIKNVFTNALAAAQAPEIEEVWAFAPDLILPEPFQSKLKALPFRNRDTLLGLICASTMVLNVSLADCHPMVNIESQTFGRPCIRSALHLDALEHHPYVELTSVRDASSVREIRAAVERVLSVSFEYRTDLTLDYQRQSDIVALARYSEFLEL